MIDTKDRTSNLQWNFALQLEKNIASELSKHRQTSPDCLAPILDELIAFQTQFCLLLEQVCQATDRLRFPSVNQQIVSDDTAWQIQIGQYAKEIVEPDQLFIPLWTATTAFEKTAMYYRQCAGAAVDPVEKVFSSSLAEIKKMIARRTEGALRICINHTWQKLGFSPFSLN